MEAHKQLSFGFSEIAYKDALMLEGKWQNILAEREKKFSTSIKMLFSLIKLLQK